MENRNSNGIIEYALAFLFVMPYAETGPIVELFRFTTSDTYWRAILSIELILFAILFPIVFLRSRKGSTAYDIKRIIIPFISIMIFFLFYSFLLNGASLTATTLFLMICVPLVNAYLLLKLIINKGYSLHNIIRKSVLFFDILVVFSIFFNIVSYGFSVNLADETKRLSASAGGPVIFGYTMAVVFAFVLSHRECFNVVELIITFGILLLGIVLTQDRGALLILGICGLYTLKNFTKKEKVWLFILLLLIIPFLIGEIKDSAFLTRLTEGKVSGDYRSITFWSALSLYFEDIKYVLFGHGFEGFFPYQHWLLNTSPDEVYKDEFFGLIQYGGKLVLVQPHNTFIYYLMETGVVGLLFFCSIFYKIYKKAKQNKSSLLLVIIAVLCMSMLESALVLETGIACTLWLMLFYSFAYSSQKQLKQ